MRLSLITPLTLGLSPEEARGVDYGDAPLGILTLASVARNTGHEVRVFDLDHLAHEICPSRYLEEAADCIASADSDVYGFGTICDSYPLTLRLVQAVRRRRPGARIVLGGPQATVTDRATLAAFPEVDAVVRGEAERILPALLEAYRTDSGLIFVPGVTYRVAGEPVRTPDAPLLLDLDDVPDPAWDLDVVGHLRQESSLEIGRGCPFACEFCSTNDFFRRKYRMKSPARVLAQMAQLTAIYGPKTFALVHDMFTVDRRKVEEFCSAAEGLGFEWGCSARTDCISDELLSKMHRAGCRKVFFGVESGSARLQKSMGKHLDLDQSRRMIQATDRLGMRSTVSLIAGFPEEEEEDLRDTADMFLFAARHCLTEVQLHLLSTLAGTPLTARLRDKLQLELTPDCWSGAPEDLDLISANPDVFINFYSMPVRMPREALHEFKLFLRCGWLRCNWLLQAMHREGGHILDVYRRFWQPERTPEWYRSRAFRWELLQFAAGLEYPVTKLIAEFYRQIPDVDGTTVLVRCNGDVLGLMEKMKIGEALPDDVPAEPSWLVVTTSTDGIAEIRQVSEMAWQTLRLWGDTPRMKAEGIVPAELDDAVVADVLLSALRNAGLDRFLPADRVEAVELMA